MIVAQNVQVTMGRIIYFRHFDTTEQYPDVTTYLASPPSWLPEEQLQAGARIDFPTVPILAGGALPSKSPLVAGTTYPVEFGGVSDPSFTVSVQTINWFDTTAVNAPPSGMAMGRPAPRA